MKVAFSMGKSLYWLAVLLYGVILFAVLLAIRFPAGEFRTYCRKFVEVRLPGFSCEIGKVAYHPPLTLSFEQVVLANEDVVWYQDRGLDLHLSARNLFGKGSFSGQPFGGMVHGTFEYDRKQGRLDLHDVDFAKIDIAEISVLKVRTNRVMRGIVSGNIDLEMAIREQKLLALKGKVAGNDLDLELKKPILAQEHVAFKSLESSLLLQGDKIGITDGTFAGPLFAGAFTGNLENISAGLFSANIALLGTLEVSPELYKKNPQMSIVVKELKKQSKGKGLPFSMAGSIRRPTFLFAQ